VVVPGLSGTWTLLRSSNLNFGPVVHEKRDFYEKVTDVNISSLFFLRWGLCFSFRLRHMLFSTVFLYALCMSIKLCVGWGPMEKSMLPVFGRPR
jgi:hypothetical protein